MKMKDAQKPPNDDYTYSKSKKNLPKSLAQAVKKRIHILSWLPSYTKVDFIGDVIAGITVGLTMMPQAIAYAALADLPAQYGLYTAFIGSFAYVFFGTIKEVSIGPTSLMALLVFSYTEGYPVEYIILLCFLCGVVQLLMGILKLGFLVDFISAPVTSGFTSATSVMIVLTQFKGLTGIKFTNHGVFDLIKQLILHILEFKKGDTILGVSCVAFLLLMRQLPKVPVRNNVLKKLLWLFSISRNALIVFITAMIAYGFEKYQGHVPFKLSGVVRSGLPNIKVPSFSTNFHNETISFIEMTATLGSSIVVVPVVGILANVAIAKAFAAGEVVDATQEMVTLGICNILGSFVQAMPACGAFTRSAVSNASGIRTPFGGMYAGAIILLALSFLTPYFYYIPKPTLSAVLISAVMFMIDYEIIPKLWRTNKFDLFVTMATFMSSLFFGVEIGLMIGCIISIMSLLKLWTRPEITSKFCSIDGYDYILIKPELGLVFPGVDYFIEEVTRRTNDNPIPVVIDFSNILKMDFTGIQGMRTLFKTLNRRCQDLVFINVNQSVKTILKSQEGVENLLICNDIHEVLDQLFESKKYSFNCEVPLLEDEYPEKPGRKESLYEKV